MSPLSSFRRRRHFTHTYLLQTLPSLTSPITALSFSSSGLYLAAASHTGLLKLYLILSHENGRVRTESLRTFNAPPSRILSLCFGPEDLLASCSMDGSVCIWHAATRHCIRQLRAPCGITCAVFSGTETVVCGGMDGKVRIWALSDGSLKGVVDIGAVVTAIENVEGEIWAGAYDGQVVRIAVHNDIREMGRVGKGKRGRVQGISEDGVVVGEGRVETWKEGTRVRKVKGQPGEGIGGAVSGDVVVLAGGKGVRMGLLGKEWGVEEVVVDGWDSKVVCVAIAGKGVVERIGMGGGVGKGLVMAVGGVDGQVAVWRDEMVGG